MNSYITYVDTSCASIFSRFLNYGSILASDIKLLTKSDNVDTYFKKDVDVFLSILQAGIHRRVGVTVVDIDGNFKINGVSNDILNIQTVDGSTL